MTLNWRPVEDADLTGWIKNAAAVVFKRPKEHVVVTKDSLYQRVHRNNMIELAKVVGIGEDSLGICHVRFQTSYAWSSGRVEPQGTRLLAMDCFVERFQPATAAALDLQLRQLELLRQRGLPVPADVLRDQFAEASPAVRARQADATPNPFGPVGI